MGAFTTYSLFEQFGREEITGKANGLSKFGENSRFSALFDISAESSALVRELISQEVPVEAILVHLLWVLLL